MNGLSVCIIGGSIERVDALIISGKLGNFIGMKYLVEIDDQTPKGAELISYIEKLKAPKKSVVVRKERPLSDGEMGLPGPKLSKAQLEAWLRPDEHEEEMPLDLAISAIKKKLGAKAKKKK
jgi:hypothetical protein